MLTCKCLRVFVVDKDPSVASQLAMTLIGIGHSVRFFTDGFQVLDIARDDMPDVLVAAIALPKLSGVELALLIRESCPLCSVVLISALPSTRDLLAVFKEQSYPFDLLTEPVHAEVLITKVETYARRSLPFLVKSGENWESEPLY